MKSGLIILPWDPGICIIYLFKPEFIGRDGFELFCKRLFTEQTTLVALNMAARCRKGVDLNGTIFHSDGGGQYYDKEFLKQTQRLGLVSSMCEYPWENGKAERINGVVKNNYLIHRSIDSFSGLVKEVDRSVQRYNEKNLIKHSIELAR